MKLSDFVIFTAAGSLIWSSVLSLLGYFAYTRKDILEKYFTEITYAFIALAALFIAFIFIKPRLFPGRKMKTEIIHDPESGEFFCIISGLKCYLNYYGDDPAFIEIYHTFVPAELRNRGLAQMLISEAALYAKSSGRKIKAACSYAENYFAKHPEFKELLFNGQ
jgi:hypothetical protein